MGIEQILLWATQAVQAGFALSEIVSNVRTMKAAGATEEELHTYLRSLAHKNQTSLEEA